MSRRKSDPAASASSRSRTPARGAAPGRGVYVNQPQSDVFVALLGISLFAILAGCLLLILHLNAYDFATKVSG